MFGAAGELLAQPKNWVGINNGAGAWNNPDAWSPVGQPLGGDDAMITLPGASVTYANPDLPDVVLSRLSIGALGGLATMTVGQHTLNTSQLEVGGLGSGAIVHTGGTINVLSAEGAILGDRLLTIGSYSLSGTGQLNVAGQLIVGDQGLGTFTQGGGAVRVTDVGQLPGTIVLASNDTSAGTYTMSAGTIDAGVLQLSPFGGVATFNQGGGQVNLRAELVLGDPMITGLLGSATYDHNGGSLVTPLTSIGETGTLKHSGGIYRTGGLLIDTNGIATGGGKLDVTNRNLVVDYSGDSPLSAIQGYVRSAYLGGTWGGAGITSSIAADNPGTSVGYAEASDVLGLSGQQTALWNGQVVDATSVLLDYTLAGDADMNSAVDFNDLARLAQNYNGPAGTAIWSMGDFDHSGNVDFNDLALMAQNYNKSLPAAIPGAPAGFDGELARAFATVPEPGSLMLLSIGVAALGRWRRGTFTARS
jgi:hypothetical protein